MKLVNIKCPNCGSQLEVKNTKGTIKCNYCGNEFLLDDEVQKIEIKWGDSAYTLENANTYLEKFKDYYRSELIFSHLLQKDVGNKELLLGLIRSITHDFKRDDYEIREKGKIETYWNKYCAVAGDGEVKAHQKDIDKILEIIHKKIEKRNKEKKQDTKFILILAGIFVALNILRFVIATNHPMIQRKKEIKMSTIASKCNDLEKCNLNRIMQSSIYSPFSDVNIDETVKLDLKKTTYQVKVKAMNRYGSKTKKVKFTLEDDMGPVITDSDCTMIEKQEFDFEKCLKAYDMTNGEIKLTEKNLEMPKDLSIGKHQVVVTASDKEKHTTKKTVELNVLKTPISKFELKVGNLSLEKGASTNFTVTIEPAEVDQTYQIDYDENLLTVEGNTITAKQQVSYPTFCVTSNYDSSKKTCEVIHVTPICSNEYTMNYNGGSETTIKAGEDICPGTYRVYAPRVQNYNDFYYFYTSNYGWHMTVYKPSSYLNDEGSLVTLNDGNGLKVPVGVTQVRLVKN